MQCQNIYMCWHCRYPAKNTLANNKKQMTHVPCKGPELSIAQQGRIANQDKSWNFVTHALPKAQLCNCSQSLFKTILLRLAYVIFS